MPWLSASIDTDSTRAQSLSDALLEAGALSVSIEDAEAGTAEETPQFGEPGSPATPVWEHSRIIALFEKNADIGEIIAACASETGFDTTPAYTLEEIVEQNWVQLTQAQFEPIRISERLWIVPSWHTPPDPEAIVLVLDPGMAFGTGSHPTTRLCLEWLESHVKANDSILDYGCGSGILAIAAARLGASKVIGLDIDVQAVSAATANAERNHVDVKFCDSSSHITETFDIVVANILSNPLKALAPALCSYTRTGGYLALSGILEEQSDELIRIYAPYITLEIAGTHEGWVCLAGRKT